MNKLPTDMGRLKRIMEDLPLDIDFDDVYEATFKVILHQFSGDDLNSIKKNQKR